MKTIETVYNKLNSNKTELGTHKVELSVADDIKNSMSQVQAAISDAKATLKTFENAKSEFAKAEKIANELGVNSSSIKDYNKLESATADLMDLSGDIEDFDFNLGQ